MRIIGKWAPMMGAEWEAQEARREELEGRIVEKEVVASRVIGLIETGLVDLAGASNGIITWNQGNIQAMVELDNLIMKLGQETGHQ